MGKAEDRALEAFPLMSNDDKEGLEALKYIGMECECASVFNEAQEAKQSYFIEGYRQAEKDFLEQENIRVPRKKRLKWRKSTELPDIKNDRWYIAVMTYRHKRWSLSTGEFVDNSKYPDYENPLWVQVEDDVKIMWKDVRKWCYYEELIDYITESWRR